MNLDIEAIKRRMHRVHNPDQKAADMVSLVAEVERLRAQVDRIKGARSNHPKCDKYEDDEGITCGWMRVVQDIDRALEETE